MSSQSTSSPDVILQSVTYELNLVITNCTLICIAIALVSLGRSVLFALLYWGLKMIATIKLCTIYEPPSALDETNASARMLTDCFAYFVISTGSEGLLEAYFNLKVVEQRKYGIYYNFTLNFMWALQADFLIRLIYVLFASAYDVIWPRQRPSETPVAAVAAPIMTQQQQQQQHSR